MTTPARSPRPPTLIEALIPIVCLIAFLTASVLNLSDLPELAVITPVLRALAAIPYFGSIFETGISVHIPLIGGAAIASIMALRLGYRWQAVQESFLDGIRLSLSAVLILLVVGALIATWVASGIVPLLIVFGLKLLSPSIFLVATCVICGIVSLFTGSSWTTAGTVGIALIGVGQGLGVPLPMVAGAIISGAYFGDKMSPLSDTTNLAPGIAGAELFEHVRHMSLTTGPSFLIALLLYGVLGIFVGHGAEAEAGDLGALTEVLSAQFALSGWLLLPPVVVLGMVIARVPALPALFIGAILGGAFASIFQGVGFGDILTMAHGGFVSATGNAAVDDLLSRGGIESMYGTVGIVLCAMCFGGVMEKTGMLGRLAECVLSYAKTRGGLVTATVASCIGINIVAADQYLSIVVPGRMYREAYARKGLHPKNLSRVLEDAGTLTSPLVPWNSCGAYMFATLGVFPLAYLPFAFLNLLNPLISILYGYTGWTMVPAFEARSGADEPDQVL